MKRVNTIGRSQANKCLTMAAIAYNLKKLLKYNDRLKSELKQATLTQKSVPFIIGLIESLTVSFINAFGADPKLLYEFNQKNNASFI